MADPTFTRRTLLASAAAAAGLTLAGLPRLASGTTMMKIGPGFKDPSVVYFGGRYLMYSSGQPLTAGGPWRQTIQTSPDGANWTELGDLEPQGSLEAKGICAGGAIVIGSQVHLFYQTYGGGKTDAICHAVSDDGVTFIRNPGNPIIRPTGTWTCGRAIDAGPVIIGDQLFVYWATRDPSYTTQMVGAHSAYLSGAATGFAGARWYQRAGGIMLKPKYPWEGQCIEAPTVTKRPDGTYVMFYAGAYNNRPQQIGVAFSSNGLSWTRMSDKPFLADGAAGTWNSSESGHPGIFEDPTDGATWLYYQGNNDGKSWYLSRRRITWSGHTPILGGY